MLRPNLILQQLSKRPVAAKRVDHAAKAFEFKSKLRGPLKLVVVMLSILLG